MPFSIRSLLLGHDDTLYRLTGAHRAALFKFPAKHPLHLFAGSMIRSAEVQVEFQNRRVFRVLAMSFSLLRFDENGILDLEALLRHYAENNRPAADRPGSRLRQRQGERPLAGRKWL